MVTWPVTAWTKTILMNTKSSDNESMITESEEEESEIEFTDDEGKNLTLN